MIDLAKALLIGHLTQDPEIRYTAKGMAVARLRVAVNHRGRGKPEEPSFFDVVAFGKLAENCGEYLSKGRAVLVEGRMQQHNWDDKESGRRTRLEILASSVEFLDAPPDATKPPAPESQGHTGPEDDEEPPF